MTKPVKPWWRARLFELIEDLETRRRLWLQGSTTLRAVKVAEERIEEHVQKIIATEIKDSQAVQAIKALSER